MCYKTSDMAEKKDVLMKRTTKSQSKNLSGMQLSLWPEMNDVSVISEWFSWLWHLRQNKYPEQCAELQYLAKRLCALSHELEKLYKEQEQQQNQAEEPNYWYNNIESRDLEPDEPVGTDYIQTKIDSANSEALKVKQRRDAIIHEIYPEHYVFQNLVRAAKGKSL